MDQITKIYKALANGDVPFDGGHNIYTPRELVEEVLGKIQLDGNILVMFNIEFVVSLVYTYNVDPANIRFYSDHTNKNKICDQLGVKYINSLETDMKFDVVLLNPPYDRTNEDSREREFYMGFIRKAFELGNIVAAVYPVRWTSLNNPTYTKFNQDLLDSNLTYFKWLPANTFKGIQMLTCYTISDKTNSTTYTTVEDYKGLTGIFDISVLGFYPANLTLVSLLQKLSTGKSIAHRASAGKLYENGLVTGSYPIVFRAGRAGDDITYYYGNMSSLSQTALVGKHKVVLSRNGAERKLGPSKVCRPDAGVGFACFGLETSSEIESKNLSEYLNLKTIKFIVNQYKRGTKGNSKELFAKIPEVDFKKAWTDDDLFNLFQLTAEEQKLINDNF